MAEKKITKKRTYEGDMVPSDDSIEQVVLGTLLVHSDLIHSWVQDFNEELFFNHEQTLTNTLEYFSNTL